MKYREKYEALVEQFDSIQARIDEISGETARREAKAARITVFVKMIKNRKNPVKKFDKSLWCGLIDHVTIGRGKDMTYVFRDGTDITI